MPLSYPDGYLRFLHGGIFFSGLSLMPTLICNVPIFNIQAVDKPQCSCGEWKPWICRFYESIWPMFVFFSQINAQVLENFLLKLEVGYSKHDNPYHNLTHAADVAQTTHHLISQSGLAVSVPTLNSQRLSLTWPHLTPPDLTEWDRCSSPYQFLYWTCDPGNLKHPVPVSMSQDHFDNIRLAVPSPSCTAGWFQW